MGSWPASLTLFGCGTMGGAMLRRWLDAGLPPERVQVMNRSGTPPLPGIATATSMTAEPPDALIMAVKPQQLAEAAAAIATLSAPPRALVSILAGVDLATLRTRLPATAYLRLMPNLPVAIGQGVSLLHGDQAVRPLAEALAAPLGAAEWIDDEALFDAATALAGSGPGFLFRYVAALGAAGARLGLPSDQAARLALATVSGSAALAAAADTAPAELAERVASKGGSTQAGYDVLDRGDALDELIARTLAAAAARNGELGATARG